MLKSPFSIHPKTGKVSIVFKPGNAKNMKLDEVPTINTLLDDSAPNNAQNQANMRTAVKNFQEVVFSLEKSEALRRKNDASEYLNSFLAFRTSKVKTEVILIQSLCCQSVIFSFLFVSNIASIYDGVCSIITSINISVSSTYHLSGRLRPDIAF